MDRWLIAFSSIDRVSDSDGSFSTFLASTYLEHPQTRPERGRWMSFLPFRWSESDLVSYDAFLSKSLKAAQQSSPGWKLWKIWLSKLFEYTSSYFVFEGNKSCQMQFHHANRQRPLWKIQSYCMSQYDKIYFTWKIERPVFIFWALFPKIVSIICFGYMSRVMHITCSI